MIPAHSSAVSVPPAAPGKSVKRLLPWLVAVAFFMESLDTTILNTAVPHREGARRRPAQHEGRAVELYPEPGGVHSDQRLDGRSIRHAPRVRVRDWPLHAGVVSLWHFERYPRPRRVPHPARVRRRHDVARGPAHRGAGVRKIRAHPRDELRCHTRPDWPD